MSEAEDRMFSMYISGPYTADTPSKVAINVEIAKKVGQALAVRGYAVFCPHTMTHGWEFHPTLTWQDFLDIDMYWLGKCDEIVMCPGWEQSTGAKMEYDFAKENGIGIFYAQMFPEGILFLSEKGGAEFVKFNPGRREEDSEISQD